MPAALLVIDMQYDFMPGGNLAVAEGDLLVPLVNSLIDKFTERGQFVVATQDWHPKNHGSFASTHNTQPYTMGVLDGLPQVMWPDHCVQNSEGARLHQDLRHIETIVRKGQDENVDSYSGFFDNEHKRQTELDSILKEKGIDEVYVCGLATDYCVHFTALDALDLGYTVHVILDASRGVNSPEGSVDDAIKTWKEKGIGVVTSQEVLA
eukprot:comp5663_c0_seq1/m.1552 comp5663_c0_seq1/g.1552  ORF comp5663_c0_seq1/g.1552 comp5663_c0_seq1/m.1552 type:complete len:208 (-) comp5663_c0_seq1:269-892(-)